MIRIDHLKKEYPNAVPLKDVSTVINDGDVIAIIGPSGTGKSTLIRAINMLDKPSDGHIYIGDTEITSPDCDISEVRKKLGMVFQSYNLFEHLTVIENVMLAQMDLLNRSKQEAYDKAIKLLRLVGMENRAMNYPDMLSGGQKQRVAIARTLAMDPEIILFDEPTSALDPTMVGEVQSVIRELARMGRTMMIVTHEMKFAREISNRVFYMDEGGIYEEGTPEQIFDNPQKERTRRFIYHLKVFEAFIDGIGNDFIEGVNEIKQYSYKNDINYKLTYKLQSIFEELIHTILLEELGEENRKILFTIEYDDREESATVIANYAGPEFNPEDSSNRLALDIIKSMADSAKYSTHKGEEYLNRYVLRVS